MGTNAAQRLLWALGLTGGFMVVEALVGWWSGSLALLADAGHMLGDAGALLIALVAQTVAAKPRSHERTYGARRAEVIAAFTNGVLLAFTALWIVAEAVQRWRVPEPIAAVPMLVTAVAGLGVNLLVAGVLHREEEHEHHNPNVHAALMHVLADAVGSVGAIVAAGVILFTGFERADTAVSLLVAVLVVVSAVRIVRDTSRVLMESAPSDLPLPKVEESIRRVRGVAEVHDLHAWTISEGFDVVTVHVVLEPGHHGVEVADRVAAAVRNQFGVDHVTVQPEAPPTPLVNVRVQRPDPRPS